MDKDKIYGKQVEQSFKDCCRYVKDSVPVTEKKQWVNLYNLFSNKKMSAFDLVEGDDYEQANIDRQLEGRLKQIECHNYMEYHDKFNHESTSFMYTQGLNEFKFNYQKEISINQMMASRSLPYQFDELIKILGSLNISSLPIAFPKDFKFKDQL